jgi:hypothetical protein
LDWVFIVVASFLGVLGVLTLLSQLGKEIKHPKQWLAINESRRAFIVLMSSIVIGSLSGNWLYNKSQKKKIIVKILFNLEVKLFQMEGLIISALSDTTPFKSLQLLNKEFQGVKLSLNRLNTNTLGVEYTDLLQSMLEGIGNMKSIVKNELFDLEGTK